MGSSRKHRHLETEEFENLRNGLFIKVWAELGKTTIESVIFRASNSREEVQSLKGQGVREVAR